MPYLKGSDLDFTSLKVLPLATTTSPPDATLIPHHVGAILKSMDKGRLTLLPEGFAANMCVDCEIVTDPHTGMDARSCTDCLCFVCNSIKCPNDTLASAREILDADGKVTTPAQLSSMLGCLMCAVTGVVARVPPSTQVEFDDHIPSLVASTLRTRVHLGCAIIRCSKDQRLCTELRCPVCKFTVLPPRLDEEANIVEITQPVPAQAPPANSRLTSIDLFSAIVNIDPRLASFNDIHYGVRNWANGVPAAEAGVDLRRKKRTLEWYLHIDNPQPLAPLRNNYLLESDKNGLATLAKTHKFENKTIGKNRPKSSGRKRKVRTVESTAEGILIHQSYGIPSEDAESFASVLGHSLVECLVSGAELRDLQQSKDKPKRKASAVDRSRVKVSTGVLGESAFVMARAQRVILMHSKWDQINVGEMEEED